MQAPLIAPLPSPRHVLRLSRGAMRTGRGLKRGRCAWNEGRKGAVGKWEPGEFLGLEWFCLGDSPDSFFFVHASSWMHGDGKLCLVHVELMARMDEIYTFRTSLRDTIQRKEDLGRLMQDRLLSTTQNMRECNRKFMWPSRHCSCSRIESTNCLGGPLTLKERSWSMRRATGRVFGFQFYLLSYYIF